MRRWGGVRDLQLVDRDVLRWRGLLLPVGTRGLGHGGMGGLTGGGSSGERVWEGRREVPGVVGVQGGPGDTEGVLAGASPGGFPRRHHAGWERNVAGLTLGGHGAGQPWGAVPL